MAKPKSEITGTVHLVGEEITIGRFQKREIVISVDEQLIPISAQSIEMREGVTLLKVGDEVKAVVEIEGRYWEKGDKYFSGLVLESIEVLESEPTPEFIPEESFNPSDDLPF
jgi:hypothetical protein